MPGRDNLPMPDQRDPAVQVPLFAACNAAIDCADGAFERPGPVGLTTPRQALNLCPMPVTDRLAPSSWAMRPSVDGSAVKIEVYWHPSTWPTDVEALFARAERERIGMGPAWYRNLIDTAPQPESTVHFYVLRRHQIPVAALPILIQQRPRRTLSALSNFYTSLFAPVMAPAEGAPALSLLLQAVLAEHGPLQRLEFGPMDPQGQAFASLRAALKANGLVTFDYFCHGNWYLPVRSDWPSYWQQREGSLRSTVRRMEKKLKAANACIEILHKPQDVERGIAAFSQAYARSWKRAEPHPNFMPGLIRLCAERGWLRLGLVSIGDQAIAAQLWIVAHGRAEIYKLAYDEAFKGFAPGTVLTARLLQHVFDVDRVAEVDYLIGDDGYKAQWMSERRERWGLLAYNPRTLAGLFGCLRESAGRGFKVARARLRGMRAGTRG